MTIPIPDNSDFNSNLSAMGIPGISLIHTCTAHVLYGSYSYIISLLICKLKAMQWPIEGKTVNMVKCSIWESSIMIM